MGNNKARTHIKMSLRAKLFRYYSTLLIFNELGGIYNFVKIYRNSENILFNL